jgi:hypothetical protein
MLRTKDFRVFYTKQELLAPVDFEFEISTIAIKLLEEIYNPNILYRSTGVVLEKIGEENCEQLSLYSEFSDVEKKEKLVKCFDKLEAKFGKNIIQTGFIKSTQKK